MCMKRTAITLRVKKEIARLHKDGLKAEEVVVRTGIAPERVCKILRIYEDNIRKKYGVKAVRDADS